MTGFAARTVRGSVAEVHGAAFPDVIGREVWFVEPVDAAVVLGSTQPLASLDLGEVARRHLGVVRRHSGGGAVVLDATSSPFWFDLWLPADDEAFDPDIGRSANWLGEVVVDALALLGVDGDVVGAGDAVRDGPDRTWGALVCFATVGPGEVVVDGRKAVGISQRRTRAGTRFQVVIPGGVDPAATAALFALSPPERAELTERLGERATGIGFGRSALRRAIEAVLDKR